MLVHVVTKKGHGYAPAEAAPDKYHAVTKFTVLTGEQKKSTPKAPTYQKVFGESLIAEAKKDDAHRRHHRRHAIGHRRGSVREGFPGAQLSMSASPSSMRVTFAAGLAAEGMKPFCAIYSTFLQRAYDQVVHDVAIQSLPVRFAMDRAGLGGRRRRHPCRLLRHRLSRHLAQFRGDGGGGRGRTHPHGRHRGRRSTTGPAPSAIRAARAPAWPGPPKAWRCPSARAA